MLKRTMSSSRTVASSRAGAEAALRRARRALRMLSEFNGVLVRAEQEASLSEQICRIAVEVGGYRVAWVGYAENDEQNTISIIASAGDEQIDQFLGAAKLSWSEQVATGRGPAGETIRSGAPVLVADMLADARFAPWAAEAARHDYRSALYLPMRDAGKTYGLLALYSTMPMQLDPDEIQLLQELTDNFAFGVNALRARQERQRAQERVVKVAAGVSSGTGERFFEQLVTTMTETVEAASGFIARLLPTGLPRARTVAVVADGERVPDFDYLIAESPCRAVLDSDTSVVAEVNREHFPHSPVAALAARALVGLRLDSAAGKTLGLVCVLFRHEVKDPELTRSLLQIFAARAAAELERQEADASLREQAAVLDQAQDAVLVRDVAGRFTYWNKSAERLYGWTRDEALGKTGPELLHDELDAFEAAKDAVMRTGSWAGELIRVSKEGVALTVEVRLSLLRDSEGQAKGILSINTDITARKAAELEIKRLASIDQLTGLRNRFSLLECLRHALDSCRHRGTHGALICVDLDKFRVINETLGREAGDRALQQIAHALQDCVYKADTVARYGGDEFMLIAENLAAEEHEATIQATRIIDKLRGALSTPLNVDGGVHHCAASIGVTLFAKDGAGAAELLQQVDLAVSQAKAAGVDGTQFFDPRMQRVAATRAALEADLRLGIGRREFSLHYQPQTDRANRVTGVEALLRWHSPTRGAVPPASFIPLAEETGLILYLGRWVMEHACEQLARWAQQPEFAHLSIAVNVSARQLQQPGFVNEVIDIIERTGARPAKLKLELTESVLVDDAEQAITKMAALRSRGVHFSLDDFGTGYSSFSYLKRLPLDQLKIDRSFIDDVLNDSNDAAIAQTILALGRNLELDVIAEGVETEAQYSFLAAHGCGAFQGYWFSRPLPADSLEQLLRNGKGQICPATANGIH